MFGSCSSVTGVLLPRLTSVCLCGCSEMDDQVEAQLDPEVKTYKAPCPVAR